MSETTPRVHVVKSWPAFYAAVASGAKTFELRRNDRDYQVGDVLALSEWNPATKEYTGKQICKRISYIMAATGPTPDQLPAPFWGLERGYCILGLMDTTQ